MSNFALILYGFVSMFVLASGASVSKGCQRDTCMNYGVCIEDYLGVGRCTCLQRFYGERCDKVKRTYTANLEISSITRGTSTWSKEYIKSMLTIENSEISTIVQKLTILLLNGAFLSKVDYLGSRIVLRTKQEPLVLIELQNNSTLSAAAVQVIILDTLNDKKFIVKTKENNVSIEMKAESVLVEDHDECDTTALQSCGSNAHCVNTVGSFQCNCKAGHVKAGHVCVSSATVQDTKVDWNRIFIWGGIVLVVLFWMLIVGLCVKKRFSHSSDQKYNSKHGTLSRRSTEAAVIPEIKITETQSIYGGSSRRPSTVYMNKALEGDNISIRSSNLERRLSRQYELNADKRDFDNISMRSASLERRVSRQFELSADKRLSLATSEYGSSSPYLDSVSHDGRFSDAQSISSGDSDLSFANTYVREQSQSSRLPRRTSDLNLATPVLNIGVDDNPPLQRKTSNNDSISSLDSKEKTRKVNAIASMNNMSPRSRKSSDEVIQLSIPVHSAKLARSLSSGSISSKSINEDIYVNQGVPERDY